MFENYIENIVYSVALCCNSLEFIDVIWVEIETQIGWKDQPIDKNVHRFKLLLYLFRNNNITHNFNINFTEFIFIIEVIVYVILSWEM